MGVIMGDDGQKWTIHCGSLIALLAPGEFNRAVLLVSRGIVEICRFWSASGHGLARLVSWVWRVFPGPLPRLNSKNSIPLIIFNLIGPSESFPSPKAPYSVLLSLTYLGGLGHLASHIRRTGDAWRPWIKPGGRLDQAHYCTSGQGGQDLFICLPLSDEAAKTIPADWSCGPVRVCQGMSGSVRRVGFGTFGGVWSFGLRFVPNSEGLFNGFFVAASSITTVAVIQTVTLLQRQ